MKETRYFYVPNASANSELPEEEAQHALRVLRLVAGDSIILIDGEGGFHEAEVTATDKRHCHYSIVRSLPQERLWTPRLHIAVAPTKNIDRMEWFVEKAVEIGVDEISFLNCQFSERRNLRLDRMEKIAISAMKQSRKAWKPVLNDMEDFTSFISRVSTTETDRFICHCYEESDIAAFLQQEGLPAAERTMGLSEEEKLPDSSIQEKRLLSGSLSRDRDTVVMVGPEGDFSIEEVAHAETIGFHPVSLGDSRLRTETAALVAVHLMRLFT